MFYSYTKEQIHQAEVFISDVLESHGIPDPYVWRFNREGKIIPQNSETPVEDIIFLDNNIQKIEFGAFLKIQERALQMNSGDYILWISPTHPVYYPKVSKIIITYKDNDTLVNRSINTRWDTMGSILAAKELASLSEMNPNIFENANDVRANPIFISKEKEEYLGIAIRKMLDQRSIKMMESGEDVREKERYMSHRLAGQAVTFGNNPRSCPTVFEIFSGEYWHKGDCRIPAPDCGEKNVEIGPCGICRKCEKKFDENPNYASAA